MIRALPLVLGVLAAFAAAASAADPLEELVRRVSAAVGRDAPEPQRLAGIEDALRAYLSSDGLPKHRPHPGLDVSTYMLHAAGDGSFSIAALVIRPGGATPIHDHGTWTVWGALEGRDRELRYARAADERLPALVAARELSAGATSRVPGPPDDLHRLENDGPDVSVSIHVHGADMRTQVRRAYGPEAGRVVPFVQSYVSPAGDSP